MENRIESFERWLEGRGVKVHDSIRIQYLDSSQGHGLIAQDELPKGTILFTIPRPPMIPNSPILTIGTSNFLKNLRDDEIRSISRNWVQLLISIMWERARAYDSGSDDQTWRAYFEIMPKEFDTLMFWSEDELQELQASSVLSTIGKEEAEKDYHELVVPLIRSRPELFPIPNSRSTDGEMMRWEDFYSLEIYHLIGSWVLSRSFEVDVNPGQDEEEDGSEELDLDDQKEEDEDTSMNSTSDESSSEGNASIGVAMVPLADILNAKSGCENAKLFYEPTSLNMVTTKLIKKGEQIYNTYNDPPNADLLRRYGHVDEHNPFDLAEVSMELCIKLACVSSGSASTSKNKKKIQELEARAEWAMEMGLDEIFMLPTRTERESDELIPADLTVILRILIGSEDDFKSWKTKDKLPKPNLTEHIAQLAIQILSARLQEYPTSIQTDEELLKDQMVPVRKGKAIRVRLGEKRILQDTIDDLLVQFPVSSHLKRKELQPGGNKHQKKRSRN